MLIGVISDTHGRVKDQALEALANSEVILHAGDIGSASVIAKLEQIAPVHAVLGNTDQSDYGLGLKTWEKFEFEDVHFCMVHKPNEIKLISDGCDVAICGHTHRSRCEQSGNLLYFNPGSASIGREDSPRSVGLIEVANGYVVDAKIIVLAM